MPINDLLQFDEADKLTFLHKFGRNRENIKQDIASIRTWLQKQPHIPETISDNVIVSILVSSKFNFDSVKKKIDMWYSARKFFPEFYLDPFGLEVQNVMDVAISAPSRKLYEGEVRYIFTKLAHSNPDNLSFEAHTARTVINAWIYQVFEDFSIKGFFFDCSNITFGHIKKLNPILIRNVVKFYQLVLSDRIFETHLYNLPTFAQTILNLINTLYPFKSHQKFRIHESLESIQQYFPKEILPRDYGGEELSLEELNEQWKKEINNMKSEISHQFSLAIDDRLRPEKLKDSDILGVQGNFRKLDLD